MGGHRCYLSTRVSTTLRYTIDSSCLKNTVWMTLLFRSCTAKRLLFPSLKSSMWNAAFNKTPWVIPSWPFLGGMVTGKLPLKAQLGSTHLCSPGAQWCQDYRIFSHSYGKLLSCHTHELQHFVFTGYRLTLFVSLKWKFEHAEKFQFQITATNQDIQGGSYFYPGSKS